MTAVALVRQHVWGKARLEHLVQTCVAVATCQSLVSEHDVCVAAQPSPGKAPSEASSDGLDVGVKTPERFQDLPTMRVCVGGVPGV